MLRVYDDCYIMPRSSDCAEQESPIAGMVQVEQLMLWFYHSIDESEEETVIFFREVPIQTNNTRILNYLPYTLFLIIDAFTDGDIFNSEKTK